MTGSDAKQANVLYRAIADYFANISGTDITTDQITQRDKILASGVIECADTLDAQILSLQSDFIAADDAETPDETAVKRKTAVESAISILTASV